jgi:hypothetical protein
MLEAPTPEHQDKRVGNKYYEVPRSASALFTGRQDIYQRIKKVCLPAGPTTAQLQQKRYVLYGLGGSGKTQLCLKFAEEHRER